MYNKLFSYGTLRYSQVQKDTFGREFDTQPSQLVGYAKTLIEITDPEVLKSSGERFHPIISYTGVPSDKVDGAIMLVTDEELALADRYEVDDYHRVLADTIDGQKVWVYKAKQNTEQQ